MKSAAAFFAFALFLTACSNSEKSSPAEPTANSSSQAAVSAETVSSDKEKEFKALFKQELKQLKPKWENFEFLDSDPGHYRFAIHYKESAEIDGYAEVEQDTKAVARAVLKSLMVMGYKPAQDQMTIRVHAYQPAGHGETGTALTRKLGRASYDYSSDQITFEPPQ